MPLKNSSGPQHPFARFYPLPVGVSLTSGQAWSYTIMRGQGMTIESSLMRLNVRVPVTANPVAKAVALKRVLASPLIAPVVLPAAPPQIAPAIVLAAAPGVVLKRKPRKRPEPLPQPSAAANATLVRIGVRVTGNKASKQPKKLGSKVSVLVRNVVINRKLNAPCS